MADSRTIKIDNVVIVHPNIFVPKAYKDGDPDKLMYTAKFIIMNPFKIEVKKKTPQSPSIILVKLRTR